jgi:glutamyl-tRNA synthetase
MGNLRTGFFSWLLARHYGGDFILRIEDTDQSRRVVGAVQSLIRGLVWLGIDIDEGPCRDSLQLIGEDWSDAPELGGDYGPYLQSQRLARYREVAELLVEKGVAYYADFPPGEENNLESPHTIRFKIPKGRSILGQDAVHGVLSYQTISLNDPVLLKSDGFPTYHLAVVVDDHDMRISHVFRGDDWIATFPIHLLLYEALQWDMPVFCHVPNVLGNDGKKLSKRHGATTLEIFKEQGYLPEALLNYVTLVGWSSGSDQELFSREELIKAFSIKGIHVAGGIFDYEKLSWMNGVYLRNLSRERFIELSKPFLEKRGYIDEVFPGAFSVVALAVQERVKTLQEVPDWVSFLFTSGEQFIPQWNFDDSAKSNGKVLSLEQSKHVTRIILNMWAEMNFDAENIENSLKTIAQVEQLKVGAVFGLVRVAVLGGFHTPPLGLSVFALGSKEAQNRLTAVFNL